MRLSCSPASRRQAPANLAVFLPRRHFTGGLILAGPSFSSRLASDVKLTNQYTGYHEVVCTDATVAALEARLADPTTASRPQVRISSTFFYHLSSDYTLSPSQFKRQVEKEDVVQKEVNRLEEGGERWEVERYEEGMKVGTLIQVRFLLSPLSPQNRVPV